EQIRSLRTPLLTCWPVLAEAAWLLRTQPILVRSLLRAVETAELQLATLDHRDVPGITRIMEKYQNLSTQLADSALLHLAEREGITTVFTLDRRDFWVYRPSRNRTL